ncbi:MAG: DUF1329 domain-containing protein [Proteobacteria bacterium]|nr:DUF1329 domain-containing protein [Pseudomonadota bacterium]
MNRYNYLKYFGLSFCLLFILLLCVNTLQAIVLPKIIDKTNCSRYEDILIPALFRAVKKGDFVITPGKVNFNYKFQDSFISASNKNAGKFDVNQEGDLIDKKTKFWPKNNVYGCPFPDIDQKDPMAGVKIMWNFYFQRFRFMALIESGQLIWITREGEERYVLATTYLLYTMGRPPGQEINNPDNALMYEFQRMLEPMSMKGTNTLAYTYIGSKPDTSYAYVPAIRRIRQTGSTTRSDPFMGSDSWLDNTYLWNGRNDSMIWNCVGEKTILVGFTSPKMIPVEDMPDGSITTKYPSNKRLTLNYETPGWTGVSWAPAPNTITYAPRKVWVIEQRPKDPYYSWGLHTLYVDQDTYTIWYKEVYERSGNFRTWCASFAHYSESPGGKNNTGQWDALLFIDEKTHHATAVCSYPRSDLRLYMPTTKMDVVFFSVSNFLKLSK